MYKVTFKFEDGSQVENYATEGENLLCAVAINKKGMVSEPLVQIYRLEFQYDPDMDEED